MSRKPILIALGAVIVIALAGGGWYVLQNRPSGGSSAPAETAAAPTRPQQLPDPVILVVNRGAIMQTSKIGQDVARQIGAYAQKARAQVLAQQNALEAEMRAAKGQPTAALYQKQQALQQSAARDDQQIQTSLAQARAAMEQQLGPILKQVAAERHANLLLDKQAVPFATSAEFDVTQDVIARLDQKLPSYQMTLPAK